MDIKSISKWFITCHLFLLAPVSFAAEQISISVSDSNEISAKVFPSDGNLLAVWIAPEYGFRQGHEALAKKLSAHSVEVWQANILESLFLPQSLSEQKKLDGRYVADLIEYAYEKTRKQIILITDSYGSGTALLGAREWQKRNKKINYLKGAVLFTPYTYATIPPLGLPPVYQPIIEATNIPLIIYQSEKSATNGRFPQLLDKLESNGSPVYVKKIPDTMSLFYEKIPTPEMKKGTEMVSRTFSKMLSLMFQHTVPATAVNLKTLEKINTADSGIDISLKKYRGKTTPQAIDLSDIHGLKYVKPSYRGKVTVVNFWATWCPPCIEEIPSLNRLKNKLSNDPFELISINYAEEKETIINFLKKVNVEFTVLLDQDGNYARKWNVVSYPSTFIIDKNGNIVYGVNAAIEWDSPELIKTIRSLY